MEESSIHTLSDEALIQQYRQGQNGAIVELVSRYLTLADKKIGRYPRLLKEAEDVKQEVLITFLHAVSRYREDKGASFATYVNLCTDNTIKNFLTHISAKKIQLLQWAALGDELQSAQDLSANPENIIIDREKFKSLEQAIAERLSDLEREVLFSFLEGKTYHEIAAIRHTSEKSVDNALQRVRTKLRDCQ